MTPDEFFADQEVPKQLFERVQQAMEAIGNASIRATKSQIAFRRKRAFAWVWMPGQYLKGKHAPLVLSIALPAREQSPRWKEIVEPSPGHFMHHLELRSIVDIDEAVSGWLRRAWEAAA
jgi:hypothetical protein